MPLYNDIKMMHEKFGISGCKQTKLPQSLSEDEKEFRIVCLNEEVKEFEDAETLADEIDAIVDLLVFGLGTLERMRVDLEPHWDIVLLANLRKKLCQSASESKRDFEIDLKKPEGWKAPNHQRILDSYK